MSEQDALPPCVFCGDTAESLATRRCATCRVLERSIHARREVAQRIVASIVTKPEEWPARFPGAWQHWPQSLRDVAGVLLSSYWAESLTPADLVKTITTSSYGTNALKRFADVPPRPALTAGASDWWPLFLLVARAQYDSSRAQGG